MWSCYVTCGDQTSEDHIYIKTGSCLRERERERETLQTRRKKCRSQLSSSSRILKWIRHISRSAIRQNESGFK